jgi:hypothetical protein
MNTQLSNTTAPQFTTWQALIEQGDGYLTPEQRQTFEKAINMLIERFHVTLGKAISPAEQAETFDFQNYIESMEERFLKDTPKDDELQQDVALTAARIIEQIGQIIQQGK